MSTGLLALDEPRQREGGVWCYISASRLNCWLACGLKFRLRYIDGIKTPPTPALFLGQRVHAALEHYHRHRMLGVTLDVAEVVTRLGKTWEQAAAQSEMAFDTAAEESALREQAATLVSAYLAHVPLDEPRPLGVEVTMESPLVDPLNGEDLGIPLLGIVDLVAGGEDGGVVVDFKTASRSAPPFEVIHEIQLTSYSYLYRSLTGQQESGMEIRSLVKTKKPKVEVHAYPARTDAHFRRLFAVVREYLNALDAGRFSYRPGWGCGMCEFRETHCRAWCG